MVDDGVVRAKVVCGQYAADGRDIANQILRNATDKLRDANFSLVSDQCGGARKEAPTDENKQANERQTAAIGPS